MYQVLPQAGEIRAVKYYLHFQTLFGKRREYWYKIMALEQGNKIWNVKKVTR